MADRTGEQSFITPGAQEALNGHFGHGMVISGNRAIHYVSAPESLGLLPKGISIGVYEGTLVVAGIRARSECSVVRSYAEREALDSQEGEAPQAGHRRRSLTQPEVVVQLLESRSED